MDSRSLVPAYELLAQDIKGLGVEDAFGLMSDDTALLVSTLDGIGVRFHGARHENNACAMAEGYAAATGRLGVAIIGRGPATANAMHGAIYALRTGSPVLLILGEAPNGPRRHDRLGPDNKQLDAVGLLRAAGIPVFCPNDALSARRTLAQAAAAARQSMAALLLPTNVQAARLDAGLPVEPAAPAAAVPAVAPRGPALQAAADALARSRKPLILAGGGAHKAGARDALVRLADHIGAALCTTLKAKDMFAGHPFNCGVVGSFSHGGGRRLIEQADCILAFGAALNRHTTSYGRALPTDVPLVQVDRDPAHIGRWYHADVALAADVKLAAEQLLERLPAREPDAMPMRSPDNRRWLQEYRLDSEFQPQPTARTMDPRSVGLALDGLLPADRNIVWDVGNYLQAFPYLSVPGPAHVKVTSDFASIGIGFGTAMGFACGTPDRRTVLVIGDGSFLMTMGELETVVREDLPLTIVLMNDCAYGSEWHYLKLRSMPVQMSMFPDIDYAPVAEAFGFQAATVRTLEELRALAPMLRDPQGPVFLECKINASIAAPHMLEIFEYETRKA